MKSVIPFLFAFIFSATSAWSAPATLDEARSAAKKAPATKYEKKCRALAAAKGKKSEGARLNEIFDFQWKYKLEVSPEMATYVGVKGYNDRWTDDSFAAIALREREFLCRAEMVKSIDRKKLNPTDRLSYDLFKYRTDSGIEGLKFPAAYLVLNQMHGVHHGIVHLFAAMPKFTEKDYQDQIARLKTSPEVIESSMALLREGLKLKITPPKVTLRGIPAQLEGVMKEKPFESPMLKAFNEIPATIPADRAKALRDEAEKIYLSAFIPKMKEFHKFVVETYIPGANESIAFGDMPMGKDWYAFRVKQMTTTDLTPQQIHDIGLSEVARLRAEMEKIKQEVKFSGSLEKFFEDVRSNKKFFFSSGEELIAKYRELAKRIDPELVKVFGKIPRLPYGIEPVPKFAEQSAAAAYYEGGSLEAGRPGYFFANTYNLKSRPKWEMEALTFHEAVPGHHFQVALAQEMEAGPEFRKHDGYTAYVEGWGLYAESLGYEMGFYKDPYSKFGQLTFEMWRALRLVVDTGMHSLGWSRQQAIDFMKKNMARAEHDITVEVDRYIVWAGQATAYKIGQMKFKELRERATKELGDHFDVRRFHDAVLAKGSLPLTVLETIVDEYIASERASEKSKTLIR